MPTRDLLTIGPRPGSDATRRVPGDVVIDAVESVIGRDRRRRPLLVYIHVPFCSSKCTFCTWVTGVPVAELRSSDDIRSHYALAVKEQIEYYAPRLTALGYVPDLVYWGGGTPSILSVDQIGIIANALRENFDLSEVREYTVESSPETLTADKISEFQAAGMNRISVGVQSFNESELRLAGRSHSPAEATEALLRAESQGCTNRNVDLITGFPRQTLEMLESTLTKTLELRPEHITAYSYYEARDTVMARRIARGSLSALDSEDQASAQELLVEMLTGNGYSEYMPMYYSQGEQNRFKGELHYFNWEGDHFGFGSGAFSVLAAHRTLNSRGNLDGYISSPTSFDHFDRADLRIAVDESLTLLFANGRRIAYDRFFDRFGFDFHEILEVPRMKAFRLALDRIGTPLQLTSTQAYVSPPPTGWHGGELVRLQAQVRSELLAAARSASASARSRRSSQP